MTADEYTEMAAQLDRLSAASDDVLSDVVSRDGLCWWAFDRGGFPEAGTDRATAARLCAGCPVMDECLELDLRTAGPDTVGVWGGLPDTDRRTLFPVWVRRRGGEVR